MAWSFDWPPTRTCHVRGPPGAAVSGPIVPARWAGRPGWPLAAPAPAAGIAAIAPSHATSATRIVVNRVIIGPFRLSRPGVAGCSLLSSPAVAGGLAWLVTARAPTGLVGPTDGLRLGWCHRRRRPGLVRNGARR